MEILTTDIQQPLDRLAAFEPVNLPVISLYLDTRPDQHGKANFDPFIRKELKARARSFAPQSPEAISFERDSERIHAYLTNELQPSTNTVAIFACAGHGDFFEALQLDAAVAQNRLFIGPEPHLYELARIQDHYRQYLAVLADTNSARIFVFGLNKVLGQEEVQNTKTKRHKVGGWSQARYQRHIDNYHMQHAKEVVDTIDRVMREEKIEGIVFAGDEVIIPMLKQNMPGHLEEKIIDVVRLDMTASDQELLKASFEAMRQLDAKTDAEQVQALLGAYRAGGLATVGLRDTLEALKIGQVDTLFLTANSDSIRDDAKPDSQVDAFKPDELVTRAQQTSANVRFIEDPALLDHVGGVAATLRYLLSPSHGAK
jgi:peptide chain release factor subunit 1